MKTPNLDRLAARGARFTSAYSNNMICAPSRVSMITGQYVHSHGYYGNSGPHPGRPLWMTSYLRQHGYQTAMIGKAHYGWPKIAQEFDYFRLCDRIDLPPDDPLKNDFYRMLVENGLQDSSDEVLGARLGANHPCGRCYPRSGASSGGPPIQPSNSCARAIAASHSSPSSASSVLTRPSRRPRPTTPCTIRRTCNCRPVSTIPLRASRPSSSPWRSVRPIHIIRAILPSCRRSSPCTTASSVSSTTTSAAFSPRLDAQNLTDETLIIFTADHGEFCGEHGLFHKNFGMYDSIHHIPFIVAGPGFEASQVRDELVQQIDIFPTACEFAGLPIPESVQGLSLLPLCRGGQAKWPRTAAFAEAEDRKCIRTARYRMVFDPVGHANELYDHANDPWELTNLYDKPESERVRLDLADEFLRYYARTEQQTIATSLKKSGGGGGDMAPGPTRDIWWNNMDWETVKKKYRL